MNKFLIFALLALPALTGCSSLSVYQSGKTLPKGVMQAGIGVGTMGDPRTVADPGDDKFTLSGDTWLRYGFTDNAEAGVKLSIPGAYTADARYGFLNEDRKDPLSLAAGLMVARGSSGAGPIDLTLIDCMLPVYVSKDIARWLTVYAVPRYSLRYVRTTLYGGQPGSDHFGMWGMGGGFMFNVGPAYRTHISAEYHRLQSLSRPGYYTENAGIALAFDFDI